MGSGCAAPMVRRRLMWLRGAAHLPERHAAGSSSTPRPPAQPDAGDRVIEIGCVEMLNRRLSGNNLHFYVNPERANSEDAVKHPRPDRRVPGRQAAVRGDRRRPARLPVRRRGDDPQRGLRHRLPQRRTAAAGQARRRERRGARDRRQPADGARDVSRASRTRWTRCASASRSTTPAAACTARCSTPGCSPRSTSA